MVGVFVMESMGADPLDRAVLEGEASDGGECEPEPAWAVEGSVGEQSVPAEGDAEAGGDPEEDGAECEAGP